MSYARGSLREPRRRQAKRRGTIGPVARWPAARHRAAHSNDDCHGYHVNELTKIIVLDDDPTGSQTVHGCLLLTRWDVDTLRIALCDDAPLFFILTNSRGMDALRAGAVTREVCRNLKTALRLLKQEGMEIRPVIVSRSDSTLRGHYPVEPDVIAEELGPFDAHFLVPAFFEGGRITRGSVHYLVVDGKPLPTHETVFARYSVFVYSTSCRPAGGGGGTRGRGAAARGGRGRRS